MTDQDKATVEFAQSIADGLLAHLREYELLVPGAEVVIDFEVVDGRLAANLRSTKPKPYQGHHGPRVVK